MPAAGRRVPRNGLVAVLSAAPAAKAKAGTSWLGSPPVRLRRTQWPTATRADLRAAAADCRSPAPCGSCAGFVPGEWSRVAVAAWCWSLLDALAVGYGYLVAGRCSAAP